MKAKKRIPKRHKYYGLINLINTRHDKESECSELRKVIRQLLRDFEDCEADFNMVGNFYAFASFYKENKEFCSKFFNIISCTEYNSLIYFEVLCLLKPFVYPVTTFQRDIIYLKNVSLVADSWYEALEYHFGGDFNNSLKIIPEDFQKDFKAELKKTYKERESFRQLFKPIRNAVLAHRYVTISEYLDKDSHLLDEGFILSIISFLQHILLLKSKLFSICIACTKILKGK